ncbi:RNA polymerase sigma factor [Vitreimonas sp.]|uniref:RNA polymerase sigma factor n=1 Tax=Vitreimonas sp. TaxID=3069702 RepID=UPI002EDACB17
MSDPRKDQTLAGDEASTLERHRTPLIRYFLRRGMSAATSEDLTQEAFTRLLALADKSHILNLEAYLFQIAGSVLTDHLRRRRVRGAGAHLPLENAPLDAEVLTPARVLEGREAIARAAAALAELRPKTREIFLLNRMDGLSYTQIAVRFGISPSAVEKHMIKALSHLQTKMKASDAD